MSSLSEHRKERTADLLRRAAVDLAVKHGIENVSVEMICQSVGFSRRTFFNYFPFKEAAFVSKLFEFTEPEEALFISSNGILLDDFLILLQPVFKRMSHDKEYIKKSYQVTRSNLKLMTLRASGFHEFDKEIENLLSQRLGEETNDNQFELMAALLVASIRLGFRKWIKQDGGDLAKIVEINVRAMTDIFKQE